jgi:hypothetical protein
MSDITLDQYKAEERLLAAGEARRGLIIHAAVTVVVVLALAVVNVFVASEFPWSVFPAIGMGLGVWFHWYFAVRRGEEFMLRHQDDVEREARRLAA